MEEMAEYMNEFESQMFDDQRAAEDPDYRSYDQDMKGCNNE